MIAAKMRRPSSESCDPTSWALSSWPMVKGWIPKSVSAQPMSPKWVGTYRTFKKKRVAKKIMVRIFWATSNFLSHIHFWASVLLFHFWPKLHHGSSLWLSMNGSRRQAIHFDNCVSAIVVWGLIAPCRRRKTEGLFQVNGSVAGKWLLIVAMVRKCYLPQLRKESIWKKL